MHRITEHQPFHFRSLAELRQKISALGVALETSDDFCPLLAPAKVGSFTLPNRLVILPMEGCDGKADGSPDELTLRRYHRFADGGAGLLWFEATAVTPEARANPRQLWLHEQTVPAFAHLVQTTRQAAGQRFGAAHRPLLILQLTHSGRYSRPGRPPRPIIAHHSPFLDPTHQLPPDYPLITDEELERLEDVYVATARYAQWAGFDGVDIKACHRYLVSELHASFTREHSRYGGNFENRTRFFHNVARKIRQAVPGLLVTSRLNVYDAMAYPYGFGVSHEDPAVPDLTEPLKLVQFLRDLGAPLVNITVGNPYYNPYVNRPFDLPTAGAPLPTEHPLMGVARFFEVVHQVQAAFPALAVVGGGYSWLRQFFPHFAAANVRQGRVSLVGLGRMAFAYPDCVRDLLEQGRLNPKKVCVACSSCTQIMRDGGRTGCVPRDGGVYASIYKAGRAEALDTIIKMAKHCRQCSEPGCVERCPAQVNIPRFVGFMAEGRFREAYETLREANILAAVCGYVCPAEVQCEAGCLSQYFDQSVPIRHLQRWVSRKAVEEGWAAEPRPPARPRGVKVAVVGAGPTGIAAATRLAADGYSVTLVERAPTMGGKAETTIPAERLPDTLLRREVQDVLAAQGGLIERRTRALEASFNLDHLVAEGFAAVLVAVGLEQSLALPGARRPRAGVIGALEFLAEVKRAKTTAGKVLVLGGGNSAIDAAMAAKQAGADTVGIVYRRSFAEMPAWPQERDKAIQAGVNFLTLTAPLDYQTDAAGKLTGLKVARTELGPLDAKGRRRPVLLPGTEHVLPADLVVEAIGQQAPDELKAALPGLRFTEEGLIWVRGDTLETSRPGIFAAGDIINGGTTVTRAVAEGTRAAREINQFLSKGSTLYT